MKERVDPEGELPLYRQVAEAIRYRVATGELRAGALLPSLRRAAATWGVNMHTVRRAYRELARQGVVELRPKAKALVLRPVTGQGRRLGSAGAGTMHEFIAAVLQEGRRRWALEPVELAERLLEAAGQQTPLGPVVHVVECSATQADDLAAQLGRRFRVRAVGWSLEREGEPPAGPVVATYFHYNDVRVRWPHRLPEVRFAATHPDPALRRQVADRWEALPGRGPVEVLLCEREAGMARNIVADLVRLLPTPEYVVTAVVEEPALLLERARGPVLFAPRVWGELDVAARAHPLALQVRYVFEAQDLAGMGAAAGWRERP
jgi:GntR family transcriptional regulator